MNAEIINIGNELLNGLIVNTNASWMSKSLFELHCQTVKTTVISDQENQIVEALQNCLDSQSTLFIFTGGLGPTSDDITKKVIAKFFDRKLITHKKTLETITNFFERKNKTMLKVHEDQALVPDGSIIHTNDYGTAPGIQINIQEKTFFFFPGVPHEMKALFNKSVLQFIMTQSQDQKLIIKNVITRNIGESHLAQKIEAWQEKIEADGFELAYLPSFRSVILRIFKKSSASNYSKDTKQLDAHIKTLNEYIADFLPSIQETKNAKYLAQLLLNKQATISFAESCTGGLLSYQFTQHPGSSTYFMGAHVSYANTSKIKHLDVEPQMIETQGAVSAQVVKQMSQGSITSFNSDYAIAISGIAGPGGATQTKPVGLVYISIANKHDSFEKKIHLQKQRIQNMQLACEYAIALLIEKIEKEGF